MSSIGLSHTQLPRWGVDGVLECQRNAEFKVDVTRSEDNASFYFVMECCPGRTLLEHLLVTKHASRAVWLTLTLGKFRLFIGTCGSRGVLWGGGGGPFPLAFMASFH